MVLFSRFFDFNPSPPKAPSFRARALPFAPLRERFARDTESSFGSACVVAKAGFRIKGYHFALQNTPFSGMTNLWIARLNETRFGLSPPC